MKPFVTTTLSSGVTGELYLGDANKLLTDINKESIDLVVTSPPYCIGKEYDRYVSADDFKNEIENVVENLVQTVKPRGSICWQIGFHVRNNEIVPLDYIIFDIMAKFSQFKLRNRIAWTFGHGTHSTKRFSGRHETVLWYSNGDDYVFDLDAVRVEQKYPGKRAYKGPKKGQFSGNPLGKNPGDIWEIPNVKAQHVEKTDHPCQFPIALVRRLVRALSPRGGTVLDPFVGSGTAVAAALLEKRNGIGFEMSEAYMEIAAARLKSLAEGALRFRDDVPVLDPSTTGSVSVRPDHFKIFED